jgi:CheY-like chemotaxis protein
VLDVLREILASFHHGHAYEITTARSVADALVILQRERFDLILLDMVMPGMGDPLLRRQGLDLLKRIRDLGVNAPVLMMSGDWESRKEADALIEGRSGICTSRSICANWTVSSLSRSPSCDWRLRVKGSERDLVPIRGPEEDHPRGQQRHDDNDSADPDHALCFRQPLGPQNRDNTPHTDSRECADDHKGEDHAEGEVHEMLATRYSKYARCSYDRGESGLDGDHASRQRGSAFSRSTAGRVRPRSSSSSTRKRRTD